MADVYQLAREHRRVLLDNERAAASRMTAAYVDVWAAVKAEQDKLFAKMKAAETNGEEITIGWLKRGDRLDALLQQIEEQLRRFADIAGMEITAQQRQAVNAAIANAQQQATQTAQDTGVSISWNHLPTDAVENLVGVLGDGSPVTEALIKRFTVGTKDVPGALEQVRRAFVTGAALGQGPRVIARNVAKAGAMPLDKALTFSRTEVLRAYRESSRLNYIENADVVVSWRWVASLSGSRTCAMCIAMHGTIHPLDEPFGSHPNCRCVPVPVLHGREGKPFQTGEQWLQKQEESVQNDIFGKAGAAAWRAGEVRMNEFVQESHDEKWGLTRRVKAYREG